MTAIRTFADKAARRKALRGKITPPRGSKRGQSSAMRMTRSQEQRRASNFRLFHQEIARLLNKQKDAPWSKYWASLTTRGQL